MPDEVVARDAVVGEVEACLDRGGRCRAARYTVTLSATSGGQTMRVVVGAIGVDGSRSGLAQAPFGPAHGRRRR